MTDKKQPKSNSRRNFLQGSAAASVAVVASGIATPALAASVESVEPVKYEGYRLTKHVMDYYKSAAS